MRAVRQVDPVEDEALDVQVDLHRAASTTFSVHLKSASGTGFSIFRSSVLAASKMIGIVTGVSRFAARNAAARATLCTLPPVSASLASRSRSSASLGVRSGNARAQIAFRSSGPGKGKL